MSHNFNIFVGLCVRVAKCVAQLSDSKKVLGLTHMLGSLSPSVRNMYVLPVYVWVNLELLSLQIPLSGSHYDA